MKPGGGWCAGWLLCATLAGGCAMTNEWLPPAGGPLRAAAAGPALSVRWTFDLIEPMGGGYIPVEQAAPGIDPRRGRVYAGSTRGILWALTAEGQPIYRHNAPAAIEAQPVVDAERDELYVLTVTGDIEALRASDGSRRWLASVGGTLTQPGLLRDDALYVVTEDEAVLALSREDGSILWRYRREPIQGFAIAGHAGLTLAGRRLLAGFDDGAVVALDASDGRVLWETDTSLDLPNAEDRRRFVDVDTTPVVVGPAVFVASFLGGLYALSLENGSVEAQIDDIKGVVDITATRDALLLSSAEHGLLCLNLPELTPRWRRAVGRGAAAAARVEGDIAYVPESHGALLAIDLKSGEELGRIETGHGVSAPATLEKGRGFALSNAGRLFAFTYPSAAVGSRAGRQYAF